MRQMIAGNWKMNGLTVESAALAKAVAEGASGLDCDMLVCPPFLQVASVAALLAGTAVAVGGQDCHTDWKGAHTGDVSAQMLADVGASYVIIGHSERRQNHGETNTVVRAKSGIAAAAGLTPIVCVGETEAERIAGLEFQVVGAQLAGSLTPEFAGLVAYEPVWAIGTGRTPTLADVAAMHGFIRAELVRAFGPAGAALRILYGGSVKGSNAAELLGVPDVGGALVGGASLNAADVLAIAKAAKA